MTQHRTRSFRRNNSADALARGLGWFSIALGVAEVQPTVRLGRKPGVHPRLADTPRRSAAGAVAAGPGDQLALVHDSPVTGTVTRFTFTELRDTVATFALVRYDPDGTLDGSFGDHGKLRTRFPTIASDDPVGIVGAWAAGVALQPDGKIVVAGSAARVVDGHMDGRFALARYRAG